jgi:hypothetical protein
MFGEEIANYAITHNKKQVLVKGKHVLVRVKYIEIEIEIENALFFYVHHNNA